MWLMLNLLNYRVVDFASLCRQVMKGVSAECRSHLRSEWWLNNPAAYDSMQGRIDRSATTLGILSNLSKGAAGRTVIGYAAAAKATHDFELFRDDDLPYVLDTTPYKHGRYVPGVKIPILSPDVADAHPGDTRLLLASNYLPHLLRHDKEFLDNGGHWLVIEPSPMVI